jgi:DNA mismatch endonuclease (patch repair protein)
VGIVITDSLTPAQRSVNMSAIRSQNTKPEMAVRRLLHGAGYRFRVHARDLPGKPDVVFPGRKMAIFIHGCFWHQHEIATCLDGRRPKSNTSYWTAKLDRNVERDRLNVERLRVAGWTTLTVWECETKDGRNLMARLAHFLGPTRRRGLPGPNTGMEHRGRPNRVDVGFSDTYSRRA